MPPVAEGVVFSMRIFGLLPLAAPADNSSNTFYRLHQEIFAEGNLSFALILKAEYIRLSR